MSADDGSDEAARERFRRKYRMAIRYKLSHALPAFTWRKVRRSFRRVLRAAKRGPVVIIGRDGQRFVLLTHADYRALAARAGIRTRRRRGVS